MPVIKLIESTGYKEDNLTKLKESLSIIDRVINSDSFKQKVKTFPFHYRKKLFGAYIDTPHSNLEILSLLENPGDYPGKINHNSIDLYLHLIEGADRNKVGFGFEGEKKIYTYRKMFMKLEPQQIANHLVHEWLHKLGFTHAEYTIYFDKRHHAVPYAIGGFIEALANQV